jgi:hypothetical protein
MGNVYTSLSELDDEAAARVEAPEPVHRIVSVAMPQILLIKPFKSFLSNAPYVESVYFISSASTVISADALNVGRACPAGSTAWPLRSSTRSV